MANLNVNQNQNQIISEHPLNINEPPQPIIEPSQNANTSILPQNSNLSIPLNASLPLPPQNASSPMSPQPASTTTLHQNVNDQGLKVNAPLELGNTIPIPKLSDLSTSNILKAIDEFDSSIPDAVVQHLLNVSGMQTTDQRIIRMIAIAAQKFIHEIVSDSLQHCKLRATKKAKDKKYTLSIEDLSAALAEYGIEVRRQQYFN